MSAAASSVQVAVRVRPMAASELMRQSTECVACMPDRPEILIGADRSFLFDQVYDQDSVQQDVYEGTVQPLVERFLEGYNATVLAYGQTGSGKTFSMGTGLDTLASTTTASLAAGFGLSTQEMLQQAAGANPYLLVGQQPASSLVSDPELEGIIPRAAQHIFQTMSDRNRRHPDSAFEVRVSFLELYAEELIDLLHPRTSPASAFGPPGAASNSQIQIREDGKGGIEWVGVRQVLVSSVSEMMEVLRKGTIARRTGSTDMNLTSSRSHAVFSLQVWQRRPVDDVEVVAADDAMIEPVPVGDAPNGDADGDGDGDANADGLLTSEDDVAPRPDTGASVDAMDAMDDGEPRPCEMRTFTSKFHFVDLAGSERLKKTNATGDRKKEGIAINSGLLALGNVISALVDRAMAAGRKEVHVPYRDSKLTRLLQDSLGGNSQTTMLACVSPADSNFAESLSTLRYASRARKIQNRARVNMEDPAATAAEVARLKKLVGRLQMEIENLRNAPSSSGNQSAPRAPMKNPRRGASTQDEVGGPNEGRLVVLESQLYKSEFETNRLRDRVRELEDECVLARAERDTLIFKQMEAKRASPVPRIVDEGVGDEEVDTLAQPITGDDDDDDESIHPMIVHYVKRISELESRVRGAEDEVAYWRDVSGRGSRPPSAVPSTRAGSAMDLEVARAMATRLRIPTPNIDGSASRGGSRLRMVVNATSSEPSLSREGTPEQDRKLSCIGNASDGDTPRVGRSRCNSAMSMISDHLLATPCLDDLSIPVWDPENQTEDEYLEDILTRINSSIVMREGLMQQIEALQQALIMKEDLVEELEDTRFEQARLVEKYEEKIAQLAENMHVLERERNEMMHKLAIPLGAKDKMTPELRWQFENKMKVLVNEISGLRKESTCNARSMEAVQKQNESANRNMRQNLEQAKVEKMRLLQRMRDLEERSREVSQASQRELQGLRRKERQSTEKSQKLQRQLDMQKIMMKRQQEENAMMMNKMRILVKTMDKQQQSASSQRGRGTTGSASALGRRATINSRGASAAALRAASRETRGQSWRRNSTGASLAAEMFGEPNEDESASGIRVSFKKQLLEREITLSVAKRQIASVLQDLMVKRDRLLDEKTALLEEREMLVREEAEIQGQSLNRQKPRYMDDRVELIDAEAAFLAARIRGLRLEAAQMRLVEEGDGPLGRDVGYDNAINMLMALTWQDARRMCRLLLDDVIRLRVEHWSRQMVVGEMEKGMMDLRRTLLVMRKTAITASAEYEKRLRSMERALSVATLDGDLVSEAGSRARSNSMMSLQEEPDVMSVRGHRRTDTVATVLSDADLMSIGSIDTTYRRATMLERQLSIESTISADGTITDEPNHPANVYDRIYERGILSRAVRSIEETRTGARRRAYTCRSDGYFQFKNIGKVNIPSDGTQTISERGSPPQESRTLEYLSPVAAHINQFHGSNHAGDLSGIGGYTAANSSRPASPAVSMTSTEVGEWWSQDAEQQLFESTGHIGSPIRSTRMVLPVSPPRGVASVVKAQIGQARSPPASKRPVSGYFDGVRLPGQQPAAARQARRTAEPCSTSPPMGRLRRLSNLSDAHMV